MTDGVDGVARRAVRLTFRVEGTQVELIDQERVAMVPPPSAEPFGEARSGFWFELQDEGDRALYRRIIASPLSSHVEVPTGDPDQPLVYQPQAQPGGVFTILVPDLPEGSKVVLLASQPEREPEPPTRPGPPGTRRRPGPPPGDRAFGAKEVARFELRWRGGSRG
jgi:hypothetical protein